ncbi:hypothetical protein ACQPYE_23360 [Actinosynnema sp. CA-299493]
MGDDLRARIGTCASRAVLDELGAEMTSGLNHNGPVDGSYEVAYLQAATDTLRLLGMGSVYRPGLRTGDSYSLTTLNGTRSGPSSRTARSPTAGPACAST